MRSMTAIQKINLTPAARLERQHLTISKAISMLEAELNKMSSEINPLSESWADVSKFGHVSELASEVIERLSD